MGCGGYRKNSGRSKSGYYKGIYCGSTYELCWVIYSLDHNISFTRFEGKIEKDGIVYYPDFLLGDGKTIIETKGYEPQQSVDKKTKVAESFGYKVKVLRKSDLGYAFDYVKLLYNTKKFHTLYDGYKPKFTYTCNQCQAVFETDKSRKSSIKFCSRRCSGLYRKKLNGPSINRKIAESLKGKPVPPYTRKYKQIWITNGTIETRIKYDSEIPDGFTKGRIVY